MIVIDIRAENWKDNQACLSLSKDGRPTQVLCIDAMSLAWNVRGCAAY